MEGRALSHYEIIEELGRGGMATVHRARDKRHDRHVAVKVMLPEIASSIGPRRFLSEIEIAARLQHPGIVPVFDSGDDGGQLFFVMPLIEGESLRARLDREKSIPVDEAMRLVREVAEALGYAHGEGVVHRDLKPENILVSRGHALLSDFGIARASHTDDDHATHVATQAGVTPGTPAYMSLEQASGAREIGPASDVYSLGCVLYELLTGELPFQGETAQENMVKRLTTDVPSVRSRRGDVPAGCDAVITRATARDASRRYADALEFADALASCHTLEATPEPDAVGDRSIAVVPFDNMSPEPNDAYLADGLTEELIADLSKVPAMRVIARNSSAAARARTRDLKEIAQILDVRYLLEGSVRRAGSQLRITAQLIDGTTDAHLWADKYSGSMDDVFEMQERISRTIVDELRVRLGESDPDPAAAPVTDIETYELYLRAKHLAGESVMRMPEAMACLEEAIRRDPSFAPACCAMGTLLVQAAFFGYTEPRPAFDRVKYLADCAIAIDPRSGAAHGLLAAVAVYRDQNWEDARRLYRRAEELAPGGFDRLFHAWFLTMSGQVDEAVREAQAGRRLDPLSYFGQVTESAMHLYAGNWDQSLRIVDHLIDIAPAFPEGYHVKGYLLLVLERYAEALPILQQAVDTSHRAGWPVAKTGCALAHLGSEDDARDLLAELERRVDDEPISPAAIATLHLHLGDRPAFYQWAHRSIDECDPFAMAINRERLWDPARDEAEFGELVRRVGLGA